MKKQLFSLALVALAGVANAQNDNPYAAFGYEGTVLTTPQERQQVILLIENADTLSPIRKIGIDPAKHRLYYFSAANAVIGIDTLLEEDYARFLSVDPLRRDYPELTTYQFASNTPIQAIDLDGLEAYVIREYGISPNGTKTYTVSTDETIKDNFSAPFQVRYDTKDNRQGQIFRDGDWGNKGLQRLLGNGKLTTGRLSDGRDGFLLNGEALAGQSVAVSNELIFSGDIPQGAARSLAFSSNFNIDLQDDISNDYETKVEKVQKFTLILGKKEAYIGGKLDITNVWKSFEGKKAFNGAAVFLTDPTVKDDVIKSFEEKGMNPSSLFFVDEPLSPGSMPTLGGGEAEPFIQISPAVIITKVVQPK